MYDSVETSESKTLKTETFSAYSAKDSIHLGSIKVLSLTGYTEADFFSTKVIDKRIELIKNT